MCLRRNYSCDGADRIPGRESLASANSVLRNGRERDERHESAQRRISENIQEMYRRRFEDFSPRWMAATASAKLSAIFAFRPAQPAERSPFSRMDLICCRNVLIYLEPSASKVISLLHYALRPALSVLGSSEGVGATASLFAVEDRTHKIFSNKSEQRVKLAFLLHSQAEHKGYARCG